MATETTTKKTTGRTTTKPAAASTDIAATEKVQSEKPVLTPREIDPTQYVTVRNGFHGLLVYVSKRTGETFVWDSFGDEQEMELRELVNAKNSSKGFFRNNWFMFDEDWVVDYLGLRKFYKNSVSIDEIDNLFTYDADELQKVLKDLPAGQKKTVAYRARQMIADGKIDSLKVVGILEDTLGIQLIER